MMVPPDGQTILRQV